MVKWQVAVLSSAEVCRAPPYFHVSPLYITADVMDERFFNNSTEDNVTSSWNVSSLPREESTMSSDQLYACDLYKFVMSGVVQLIVSIVGFVGKSIKQQEPCCRRENRAMPL